MLQELKSFVKKYDISLSEKIGVAVSGGLDSMLLLSLLSEIFEKVHVFHVNYNLRGKDSKLDEEIVQSFCVSNGLTFHLKSVKLEDTGKSIQEEARNIRYDWFESISESLDIKHVFIAHHLDDQLETFLMNLERGSGLTGLSGMPERNDKYLRPLLSYSKEDLKSEVEKRNIGYREDKSNLSNKYLRNSLRNNVIPGLKSALPNILKGLDNSLNIIKDSNDLISQQAGLLYQEALQHNKISYSTFEKESKAVLVKLMSLFDFSLKEANKILLSLDKKNVGAVFKSGERNFLIDRESIIISSIEGNKIFKKIEATGSDIVLGSSLFEIEKVLIENVDFSIEGEFIDADKLSLPFIIRSWKEGDSFRPLGMKGFKKVSDFLIDSKINRFEKDNVVVIESDGKIAAVLPYRVDDRFKIDKASKSAYLVNLKKK